LVFADSSIRQGLADASELQRILQEASDSSNVRLEFYTTYARDLSFLVTNDKSRIYDHHNKQDLKHYDFVYFRRAGAVLQQMLACALYLEEHHVPYFDSEIGATTSRNKLSQMFLLHTRELPIPPTLFCRNRKRLLRLLTKDYKDIFTWPIVAKATGASRGDHNYLVYDPEELTALLQGVHRHYLIQSFIPNDGDYRALVVNAKLRGLIKRVGAPDSHLNNTSKHGSAMWLPVDTLSPAVRQIAIQAASVCQREIAGVDIMIDKNTNQPYVLEVNRGPQVENATYPAEKAAIIVEGIGEAINEYEVPVPVGADKVLGRKERISISEFPSLGVFMAKVDTGAYSSSLHCEYTKEAVDATGTKTLAFGPFADGLEAITTEKYFIKKVTASNGASEMRFVVTLHLQIHGEVLETQVTLTNRGTMLHPMLIGRKFLKRYNYKVDASKKG